jgi:putative hemolysin
MLIFLAALCALIEAFFTAQEVALGAISRARLRSLQEPANHEDDKFSIETARNAAKVLTLLERPDRLTLFFITMTSLSLWGAAALLTWEAINQSWPLWSLPVAFLALLFVAEVIPLLIAAKHSESLALRCVNIVSLAQTICSPATALFGAFGYALARIMGSGPNATPQVTEGELRTALAAAEEEGVIESEERALLEGAMDFRDKSVREVMTPRPDIIAVAASTPISKVLELALREGHSRLPVYEKNIDNIIGFVATKDLLTNLKNGVDDSICARHALRKPFFVPEFKRVAATLEELRRGRTLMAVVIEENGGTAGLVTIEDLLEELVGEIQDEYDLEEAPLRLVELDNGTKAVIADADSTVRDFGRFFGREFKMSTVLQDGEGEMADSGQTLASLALELFGALPEKGSEILIGQATALTPDIRAQFGLLMKVTEMANSRIGQVQIQLVAENQ